jgi:hypothetical protein
MPEDLMPIIDALLASQRHLTDAQTQTDTRLNTLVGVVGKLADMQKHTDGNLDTVVDIVRQHAKQFGEVREQFAEIIRQSEESEARGREVSGSGRQPAAYR